MEHRKRLYRSQTDKVIGGVCGGLAEYLNVDPIIVRVLFILVALFEGAGLLIYIILWIVTPGEEQVAGGREASEGSGTGAEALGEKERTAGAAQPETLAERNRRTTLIIGGALIVAGTVYLLHNLNLFLFRWLDFGALWPVLLIVAGFALLWRRLQEG